MKKWVFGCAMALVITSCDNKKFSIQGRVADADGQVLYLESLAVNGTELLDSVELDKDGRFKFKYHAPQYPEFYQLRLDKSIIHLAIDSTETLNLSANAADFANDYELTGSDECVKMRIVAQESAKLKKRIDELSRAMSSNSDRVDDLRKQAIEDLAAYKKKMFDLVLENPASATAYYIVFQEINGDKIFDPYDADDRKLIAAVATGFDSLYPDSPRSKQLKNMTLAAIAAERAAQKEKPERRQVVDIPRNPEYQKIFAKVRKNMDALDALMKGLNRYISQEDAEAYVKVIDSVGITILKLTDSIGRMKYGLMTEPY